jgi:hypothetical protein
VLTGDGATDLILSTNSDIKSDVRVASNSKNLTFLKGTSDPYNYVTWTKSFIGGTPSAFYARDIYAGDFGSGHTDLYVADATEFCISGSPCFQGTQQYIYLNDGQGNLTKTAIPGPGMSSSTVHGVGMGSAADGFGLAFNTPFNNPNNGNILYSTVTLSNTGVLSTTAAAAASGSLFNGRPFPQCFYTAAVQRNASGQPKDLICFSQEVAGVQTNHVIGTNRAGQFVFDLNIAVNSKFNGWAVEDVAIGNFSGHTDGRQDFAVLQVDRTGSKPTENTAIRLFINTNGVYTDQTDRYFGGAACGGCLGELQNDTAGFHRIKTVDLNNDGKDDIVFIRENNHGANPAINDYTGISKQIELLLNTSGGFARKSIKAPAGLLFGNSFTVIGRAAKSEIVFELAGKLYVGVIQ